MSATETTHRVYVEGRAGMWGGLAVKCACGEVLAGQDATIHSVRLTELLALETSHIHGLA